MFYQMKYTQKAYKDHSFERCDPIHLFRILSTRLAVGDCGLVNVRHNFTSLLMTTRSFIVCCSLTYISRSLTRASNNSECGRWAAVPFGDRIGSNSRWNPCLV